MELVDSRNQLDNPTVEQALRESIKKLVEDNPNGGEVTLSQFCKKNSSASRTECVKALKKSSAGMFVTGRRGKESRFIFGPAALPLISKTSPKEATHRRHQDQPEAKGQSLDGGVIKLDIPVNIMGQTVKVPVTLNISVSALLPEAQAA